MGTLVGQKPESIAKGARKSPSAQQVSKNQNKNNKKLGKEYARIRKHLEELRQAYAAVDAAGENDDIYFRLLNLERVSKRLRKGRVFSKGAKSHRKLLKKLR